MRVREARAAPRYQVPPKPQYETYSFPAPIRGWVVAESLALAQPGGALVLENFRPTKTGARLRGGSTTHAIVTSRRIASFMTYKSGSAAYLFAASNGAVYDVTNTPTEGVEVPSAVSGQTSDYYSSTLFATVGEDYLLGVNGSDPMLSFDGAAWRQIDEASAELAYDGGTGDFAAGLTVTGTTSSATAVIVSVDGDAVAGILRVKSVTGTFQDNEALSDTDTGAATANGTLNTIPAITGVDTSTFSAIWPYRNRLFFVKKNTKSAWYLPVDSIGGAAVEFTLDGTFKRGGALLFGTTWSLDAGDGLDDKCVFVSTVGEVAVFEGSDPSDNTNWSLVGRYDMPAPMGLNATMTAGGDVLIATKAGIVSLVEVLRKDPAALSVSAISRNIEPEWTKDTSARASQPWELVKWPEKNIAVVGMPGRTIAGDVDSDWGTGIWGRFIWGGGTGDLLVDDPYCYVVNLETGAWAKYTGWDVQCLAYHEGKVYFGTSDGRVVEAETGGSDDGEPYYCRYAGLFEHINQPGVNKSILMARPTFTYSLPFNPKVSISTNYIVTWPSPPSSAPNTMALGVWDAALWDQSAWDTAIASKVLANFHSIGRNGYAIAPMVQVMCGTTTTPDAELVAFDITYETGGVLV